MDLDSWVSLVSANIGMIGQILVLMHNWSNDREQILNIQKSGIDLIRHVSPPPIIPANTIYFYWDNKMK